MISKLTKAYDLFRNEGISISARYCASYLGHRLLGRGLLSVEDICYQIWHRDRQPSRTCLSKMRAEATRLPYRPLISIVMPVFNVDAILLCKAIESVESQAYENWELCIADDCSTKPDTKSELGRLPKIGNRVKITFLKENSGIAGASNAAIELAKGEFIALLDHDDELPPDALFEMVKLLNSYPETDMIYSDEDKLDELGRHVEAFMKPEWSPEFFLSNMYTCHLGIYRRSLIDKIGGFRKGFEGAQDHDLVLRLTEHTDKILHVPKVLYHWRRLAGSTAAEYGTQAGGKSAMASSRKALQETLARRGIEGTVEPGLFDGNHRVRPTIPDGTSVSIIIPTKDNVEYLCRCVESIKQKTEYPDYEIVIANNQSAERETMEYLASLSENPQIRTIDYNDAFNFSAINNFAADLTKSDYLLFLNNDTEVINPGWLEAMLELAQIPGVGVVGPKLLYPDDTIQHAGIVLWHCGTAGHLHSRLPKDEHGYFGMANSIRNCSAVSAACMLVRKDVFRQLGGFDTSYVISYQDVDFCLRAQERGLRVVYTPFSLLYHHESTSTGKRINEEEERLLREKWGAKLPFDKYYNPNFPFDRLNFRLCGKNS